MGKEGVPITSKTTQETLLQKQNKGVFEILPNYFNTRQDINEILSNYFKNKTQRVSENLINASKIIRLKISEILSNYFKNKTRNPQSVLK